eukprot:2823170-Prymnesium_polylepis.1
MTRLGADYAPCPGTQSGRSAGCGCDGAHHHRLGSMSCDAACAAAWAAHLASPQAHLPVAFFAAAVCDRYHT